VRSREGETNRSFGREPRGRAAVTASGSSANGYLRNVFKSAVLLGLLAVFPVAPSSGGVLDRPEGVKLSSSVSPSRATVGDLIHYRLTLSYPDSFLAESDRSFTLPEQFELMAQSIRRKKPILARVLGRRETLSVDYTFACYQKGDFTVPGLQFTLRSPSGREIRIGSPPVGLEIVSVLPAEGAEMKDIKPPVELARKAPLLWMILASAAVLAGAMLILLFRRRGKPRRRAAPALPAHVVALRKLRELMAAGLPEKGLIKPFYSSISQILREYISGRYGLAAVEATTAEVLEGLKAQGLKTPQYSSFKSQLELCDLVKFAKYVPPGEVTGKAVYSAMDIVRQTKLEPPEPKAGAEGTRGGSGETPSQAVSAS